MTKQIPRARATAGLLALLMAASVVFFGGCALNKPDTVVITEPVHPAPVDTGRLRPGLNTVYFYDFYRYVSQLPEGEEIREKGRPGLPVLQLNHQFGAGNVFDSGTHKGVGMLMTGYIHLAEPGTYGFQAVSNDGVELTLDGQVVVSDPGVHNDKTSDSGRITAAEGGWVPVQVKYFQRKGTATLKMYWQPPGSSSFTVIPAEAYAHLP